MTLSLPEIYKSSLDLTSETIQGESQSIHLVNYQGKLSSYPRMLEYFIYESQDKFNKDSLLSEKLIDFILRSNKKIRIYSFGDSSLFKAFPEHFLNNNNRILNLEFVTNVLHIDFNKHNNFENYLLSLKRKRRYKANKVLKDYDISVSVTDDINEFEKFVDMHKRQWDDNGDPSILNDDRWYQFYRSGFENGLFNLHSLSHEGKTIAYHLGFILDQTFHYLMPTFTHSNKLDSPGFALLIKLIEKYNVDPNIKRFSLGSGDYSYKRWLANGSQPLFRLSISTSRLGSLVLCIRLRLKEVAMKLMKKLNSRK